MLRFFACRNVFQAPLVANHLVLLVPYDTRIELGPDDFSVAAIKLRIEQADDPRQFERVQQSVPLLCIGEEIQRLDCRQRFPVRIAQHFHQGRVGIHDCAVGTKPEKSHRHVIEQVLVTPLRLMQRFPLFRPLQGHVHG